MPRSSSSSYLPSLGDMQFLFIFFFPLFLLPTFLFGDGGTGWHLVTGQYIFEHASLPARDFLTYTFRDAPWVQLYWLSDFLMYLAERLAGLNGVAVLISSVIATTFLLIYDRLRYLDCTTFLALALVFAGALASSIHFLARPHVFGFPLMFLIAVALEDFHRRKCSKRRLLLTIVLVTCLWANFHPAFLMGLGTIAIYLVTSGLMAIVHANPEERKASRQECVWLFLAFVLGGAATIVNPCGTAMIANILENMTKASVLAHSVDEFLSPNFHGGLQVVSFELILALIVAGLAITAVRPSLPQLLTVLAFGYLALYSVRHIPFFVIVTLPFIAECFSATRLSDYFGKGPGRLPLVEGLTSWIVSFAERVDAVELSCNKHLLPVLAMLVLFGVAALGGTLFGQQILNCHFDPHRFPTSTLACIKKLDLKHEQGFNHVNWGGYIFYTSRIPVFIDDRASLFGEKFYLEYGRLVSLFPEWHDILRKHNISWVIFPKNSDLSLRLQTEPDWKIVCQDDAAYLFVLVPRIQGRTPPVP